MVKRLSGSVMILILVLLTGCSNHLLQGVKSLVEAYERGAVLSISLDGMSLTDGDSILFDDTYVGNDSVLDLVIADPGNTDLFLTSNPPVIINGDVGAIEVSLQPDRTVTAGGETILRLRFEPSATGEYTVSLAIPSSDSETPRLNLTVSGTGYEAPDRQLDLFQDTTEIESGDYFDLGVTGVGSTKQVTYTLLNSGIHDTSLTGSPAVVIGGTNPEMFSLVSGPDTELAPGESTTFTLEFQPSSGGACTADILIEHNLSDEGPLTFSTGVAPVLSVEVSSIPIAAGGEYDCGDLQYTNTNFTEFSLSNSGSITLDFSGPPALTLSGTDTGSFTIESEPGSSSLSPGASTSCFISFTPGSGGQKTAELSIASNDVAAPSYTINLTGYGLAPEFSLSHDDTDIADGGNHDMGNVTAGSTLPQTFTIDNIGDGAMSLLGVPLVEISGTDASMFTVTTQPASVIPAGDTTTFVISFSASATGDRSATVTIPSNDPDEGSFAFDIAATGAEWHGVDKTVVGTYKGERSSISVEGDDVYIAHRFSTYEELWLSRSSNGGATWSSKAVDDSGNVGDWLSMASVGETIYISYYDELTDDLKLARSEDGGDTFTLLTIESTGNTGLYSSIEAVGETVYLSYYDSTNGELKFRRSDDGGDIWTTVVVDDTVSVYYATGIAVSGSSVYISYYDNTNDDLKVAVSSDNGDSWSASTLDSDGDVGRYSDVAAEGTDVFVSYFDDTNDILCLAKSEDSGVNWTVSELDDRAYMTDRSSITVDTGRVFISYMARTSIISGGLNYAIKVARSPDSGDNWYFKDLDTYYWVGKHSSIAVRNDCVYISYADYTNISSSPYQHQLEFAKSADEGITW